MHIHTDYIPFFKKSFPTSSQIALILLRNDQKIGLDLFLKFFSNAIGIGQRIYLGFFCWNCKRSIFVQNKYLASLFL